MDLEAGATHIGEWYANKAKTGWQVQYGITVPMNLTRLLVHDPEVKVNEPLDISNAGHYTNESAKDGVQEWSVTRSTLPQMNQIMQLIDEELREGAPGLGEHTIDVPGAHGDDTGAAQAESLAAATRRQIEDQRGALVQQPARQLAQQRRA